MSCTLHLLRTWFRKTALLCVVDFRVAHDEEADLAATYAPANMVSWCARASCCWAVSRASSCMLERAMWVYHAGFWAQVQVHHHAQLPLPPCVSSRVPRCCLDPCHSISCTDACTSACSAKVHASQVARTHVEPCTIREHHTSQVKHVLVWIASCSWVQITLVVALYIIWVTPVRVVRQIPFLSFLNDSLYSMCLEGGHLPLGRDWCLSAMCSCQPLSSMCTDCQAHA